MFSRYASKSIWALLAAAWLASCAPVFTPRADAGRLPSPVTNNAVAYVPGGANGGTLYSFLGLGAGKTHADIVRSAFACGERSLTCRQVPDVPVDEGRLASSAATVAGKVYIFGGYTVAADGAEHSTPEVFRFNPDTERYERMADMPTPVDDATAIGLMPGLRSEGREHILGFRTARDCDQQADCHEIRERLIHLVGKSTEDDLGRLTRREASEQQAHLWAN